MIGGRCVEKEEKEKEEMTMRGGGFGQKPTRNIQRKA